MKNFIKSALISTLLITGLNALDKLPQKEADELTKLPIFKDQPVDIIDAYKSKDFYHLRVGIQGRAQELFITKDKKHLIVGNIVNTNDGKPLSIPVDMSSLEGKEGFTYGTGDEELILFTDTECPYCKKFESYFPQIKDKVKIKVYFYPLPNHTNAKDISAYILSKKDDEAKAQALFDTNASSNDFKNRKINKEDLAKYEAKIDEHIRLGNKIGVRGTPALFDAQGNDVSWVELLMKNGINVK